MTRRSPAPARLLLLALCALALPAPAEARRRKKAKATPTAATWDQWSASAGLRATGASTLGIGVGAHLGKTLAQGIYVGGLLDYASSSQTFGPGSNDWTATTFMAEVGYDWAATEHVILRPVALLGYSSITLEACIDGTCNDGGDSGLSIGGGGHAIYLFDAWHIGAEARATLGSQATLAVGGNVGLIF